MSRRIAIPMFFLTVIALTPPAAAGTWEDEMPVIQDPINQNPTRMTVAPDESIYVLWPDWTVFADTKVMLMRSDDAGDTWTVPAIIFDGEAYDNFEIIADATGLHVVLIEFVEHGPNENKRIYYANSQDGGVTFSSLDQIGSHDNVEAIKLFAGGGKLYLYAWEFDESTDLKLLYVSGDGGASWIEKPLEPGGDSVDHPDIVVRDGVLHLAYTGLFTAAEIHYAASADDGDMWSAPINVSSGSGAHSQLPSIVVDGDGTIHVSWEDDRTGQFEVMYAHSTDGGATFGPDSQLNQQDYGARVELLADEEGLHAAWCQYHGDDGWPASWSSGDYGIIWYRFSDDGGVDLVGWTSRVPE